MTDSHNCLLWSVEVDNKGAVSDGPETDFIKSEVQGGYRWAHLQSDAPDAVETMMQLGLPETVIEALCNMETRPRAAVLEDGMLIYLRAINRNPNADPEDMVSLRVWFTRNIVVSARRRDRRLLSVLDTKQMLEQGDGPFTSTDLVMEMVGRVANRISEVVDDLDDRLTTFEEEGGMNSSDRFALSLIRRQAAAIRRYLAPQRDALEALYRSIKFFTPEQMHALNDLTDRMARYVEDLDLAKERSMVLQDELRNRIAEQQGMRMYVLSLVTAIFLPLSFLTGVFGMNVAGLPGTEEPNAFFYLATAMGGLSFAMLGAMIWRKWF